MPAINQNWNSTSNATIGNTTSDACNSEFIGLAVIIALLPMCIGFSVIFGTIIGFHILKTVDNEYAEEEWARRGVPDIDRKAHREYLKKRTPTLLGEFKGIFFPRARPGAQSSFWKALA
jgi:hypothetical protein